MKKFLNKSLDVLKWLVKSILFGIVTIFLFNVIGVYFNLNIPVNVFTILIIGALRIPGLAAVLIYHLL